MSEVLPTDCSPRNTNLNLRRGLPKSEPDILLVLVEVVGGDSVGWFVGFLLFVAVALW